MKRKCLKNPQNCQNANIFSEICSFDHQAWNSLRFIKSKENYSLYSLSCLKIKPPHLTQLENKHHELTHLHNKSMWKIRIIMTKGRRIRLEVFFIGYSVNFKQRAEFSISSMAPIFFAFSFFMKNEEKRAIFREKRKKSYLWKQVKIAFS